jgi:iron(III) transport system ATP-binding protein
VPAHRRGIAYVSQDGALFPHLSVEENVGFAIARSERNRDARIGGLLDLVRLDPLLARRRPHELSGGQQQRVALARALAVKPRAVVLDEPFSALDAGLRESLRQTVAEVLDRARVATVLVTHDQAEALSFATHLAVLREGRLVQAGPPEELYRRPRDPETARFLGDAIILPATIGDGWAECVFGRVATSAVDGGERLILVRPEQVRLARAGATNGAEAMVKAATFGGASSAVRLAWADGFTFSGQETFLCRVPGQPPQVGERLWVSLEGTVHVFDQPSAV